MHLQKKKRYGRKKQIYIYIYTHTHNPICYINSSCYTIPKLTQKKKKKKKTFTKNCHIIEI